MNVLVNASNLKKGGGLQVATSICRLLYQYTNHKFVVVLSHHLSGIKCIIEQYSNIEVIEYDLPKTANLVLLGRSTKLDNIVKNAQIDVVLTIFGPSLWIPRCLHISGFARPHCVLLDSPYFNNMDFRQRIRTIVMNKLLLWSFKRCSDIYFTENFFITERLKQIFKSRKIYTVTNYYNQIFDNESEWVDYIKLDNFAGVTLFTVTANYPHKNLTILIPTIHYLKRRYPFLAFRFVLTIAKEDFPVLTKEEQNHIVFLGKIPLANCPPLYKQCDIVFSTTLLECFSAVYPEAMRMEKPIITTDLNFTRSLCGDAALFFDATSFEAFGDAINQVATDTQLRNALISNGKKQLQNYDDYNMRTKKIIMIIEEEYSNSR